MQLYAITDSRRLGVGLDRRIAALERLAEEWAEGGVDFIQLREKDLDGASLEQLASRLVRAVAGSRARVLVNGRADVAIAAGAAGVHLPGEAAFGPAEVRQLFERAGLPEPAVSAACHSVADVERARRGGASLAIFAPVFEKPLMDEASLPGQGLQALRRACQAAGSVPVFALGGVTAANAADCIEAGAAGVAGIRLFLDGSWRRLCAAPGRRPPA